MIHNRIIPCVLLAILAVSCGKKKKESAAAAQQAPAQYPTETVTPGTAVLHNDYPVRLKGEEDIEIRPRVEGTILKILVDEGSVVRKGQPLFTIDSPASVEGVASAQASLASAQATLASAQLDVDRMSPLAEKGIISQVQLEAYRNQHKTAQAAVEQAQAALDQARATLSWTTVTSPVDGVVGTIPYRQGSLVSSSSLLTTIANSGNIMAYFSLNEKELLDLLSRYPGRTQAEKIAGMPPVFLTLADGREYNQPGVLRTISGVVDDYTGSANFRAEFPNPTGLLRSGMSGTVSIPRTLNNVILIPQKATFSQQDKTLVYKVQGDSVVQTAVTIEPDSDGQNYVVTKGLRNGDEIVTDGVATLSNGKKIATAK